MAQDGFVLVLGGEDGVCEIAVYMAPFTKAAIIEELEVVCDDEGDDVISEAFLEHDEAPNTSIAILEGMNLLEANVEIKDVFEGLALDGVIIREEGLISLVDFLWRAGVHASDFIRQAFVIANHKPILFAV